MIKKQFYLAEAEVYHRNTKTSGYGLFDIDRPERPLVVATDRWMISEAVRELNYVSVGVLQHA